MIKCANCRKEIPGCCSGKDWGYKLGSNMYFCTYKCMREKQAAMNAKHSETMKKKAELREKEQEQMEEKTQVQTATTSQADEKDKLIEKLRGDIIVMNKVRDYDLMRQSDLENRLQAAEKKNAALLRMVRDLADMLADQEQKKLEEGARE